MSTFVSFFICFIWNKTDTTNEEGGGKKLQTNLTGLFVLWSAKFEHVEAWTDLRATGRRQDFEWIITSGFSLHKTEETRLIA